MIEIEPHKLAKKNHPLTSHIAAHSVADFAEDHFDAILKTLRLIGNGTPSEIAAEATRLRIYPLDKHQAVKRMRQLERAGKVKVLVKNGEEVMRRESKPMAKPQRVWELCHG